MNNKINQVLDNLGFSEREIKIYLSLIREQNLTALQISKKTRPDKRQNIRQSKESRFPSK